MRVKTSDTALARAVTLRCRSAAQASKGDGILLRPSFEARKRSHLRMTTKLFALLIRIGEQ